MRRAAFALVLAVAACSPPPAAYLHVTAGEPTGPHRVLGTLAVPVPKNVRGTRDHAVRRLLRDAARPLGADAVVRVRIVRTASGDDQALGLAVRYTDE